jgi:hypothetical protein
MEFITVGTAYSLSKIPVIHPSDQAGLDAKMPSSEIETDYWHNMGDLTRSRHDPAYDFGAHARLHRTAFLVVLA